MKYTKLILVSLIIVGAGFIVMRTLRRDDDPVVRAAIESLPHAKATPTPAVARASGPSDTRSPVNAPDHVVAVAPAHVVANALSLSSFFAPSEVAGLTDEQIARLELSLSAAKRKTYELLVERGTVTHLPDGSVRIEIPAQGDALLAMREHVHDSIREIVGDERMKSFAELLGPRFEAKFAYFGKYPTNVGLSFEGMPMDRARYVTMRSEYKRVDFLGVLGTGRIASTSVLRVGQFEAEFMPLAGLKPPD